MGDTNERTSSLRVMSIETGFNCNAYCGFCPQLNYRGELIAGLSPDLTTDEIRERIRYGAQQGYKQIGFSGGEPTIRKDFLELVAFARAKGYQLIGVTTNGMMLSYPKYAAALLAAGVTSINFSINGHEAKLHDAMMRTPGAFDQLLAGLDNLAALRSKSTRRIEMMSMSLAAPQVVDHFGDIVRLVGARGVKLHMIQPFLMTKGNTHLAHHYLTSYAAIEKAVRDGVAAAREHGGHVKLFNTPVCLLWDLEAELERQWKKLDVFREHEKKRPGELTVVSGAGGRDTQAGYFRVPECTTCPEPCPGFRVEYYPQAQMVAEILAALDEHVARLGAGEVWVGGLELLGNEGQRAVLAGARERGVSHLVLLSGGIGREYQQQFDEGVQRLVDEVCFVVQPRRPDARELKDRHLAHGNLDDIGRGVARLRRRIDEDPASVSAAVSAHDLEGARGGSGHGPGIPGSAGLADELWNLGVRHLRLGSERGPDQGGGPEGRDGHAAGGRGAGPDERLDGLAARLRAQGFLVTVVPSERGAVDTARLPLLRHRWNARQNEWICWSMPSWARERPPAPTAPGNDAITDADGAQPERAQAACE